MANTSNENDFPYLSSPMKIGKQLWRMRICENGQGQVVTRYEFQDSSGMFWHGQRDWPWYDFNDTYLGLPKELAKLYERERPALIKYGLQSPIQNKQLEMNF